MPTAMTFASLQEDIRAYIERGSSVDTTVYNQIPRLINNAEREIAKELKILGFKRVLTTSLVAEQNVYIKPDRWRDTVEMQIGIGSGDSQRRKHLYPRSLGYCRAYWPNAAETDEPEFYADYDYNHWLIVPTPDTGYSLEVIVYQTPPLLDTTQTTNWLTQYAPSTLLYRSLMETAPFLGSDERIATWEKLYRESMASLSGEDLQRVVDQSAVRQET